jgi:hypothetical protein
MSLQFIFFFIVDTFALYFTSMAPVLASLLWLTAVASSCNALAVKRTSNNDNYVVVLKPDTSIDSHLQWVAKLRKRSGIPITSDVAGAPEKYSFPGFRAYSGSFDSETLEILQASNDVCRMFQLHTTNKLTEHRFQLSLQTQHSNLATWPLHLQLASPKVMLLGAWPPFPIVNVVLRIMFTTARRAKALMPML